jgi:hypothetical protein
MDELRIPLIPKDLLLGTPNTVDSIQDHSDSIHVQDSNPIQEQCNPIQELDFDVESVQLDEDVSLLKNHCIICNREISRKKFESINSIKGISLASLHPRILNTLKYAKHLQLKEAMIKKIPLYICIHDLQLAIQARMSSLVDEDISSHSRLQEVTV